MPETLHLCGYIAVPPDHPWARMGYDDVRCEVHGGLTYASLAEQFYEGKVAPAGWSVLGFDCAHAGDLLPVTAERSRLRGYGEYRTIDYVRAQLENLARQAKKQAGPNTGVGADAIE